MSLILLLVDISYSFLLSWIIQVQYYLPRLEKTHAISLTLTLQQTLLSVSR